MGAAEIRTPVGSGNFRTFRRLIYLLFFLSGSTGLIHEVLWQRMLLHILGASAPSVLAVFTAFFVGIALGSALGGRLLRSGWKPLRLYGWAEVTIAVTGLAVPLIFKVVDVIYYGIASHLEDGHWFSNLLRFFLAAVCILPATAAMGATIPAMAKVVSGVRGDTHNSGRGVSIAYGLNILGGMLGCVIAGFVMIRFFGITHSLYANVAMNLVVAAVALGLSGRNLFLEQARKTRERQELTEPAPSRVPAFLIYGLAGASAIAFEIVWFRIFAILSGTSTIHFSTFLAVFLAGFGTGGLILYPYLTSRVGPRNLLWLSLAGSGIFSLIFCLSAYGPVQVLASELHAIVQQVSDGPIRTLVHAGAVASILLFVPTVFMGMTFPAAVKVVAGQQNPSDATTGDLYFAGNIGSATGALVAGLILVPILGLAGSAGALSALLLLLAAACAITMGSGGRQTWYAAASVAGALVAVAFAWHNRPIVSRAEPAFQRNGQWFEKTDEGLDSPLLHYAPGTSATVMVRGVSMDLKNDLGEPLRAIFIDEVRVASTMDGARVDAKMLAHLPLMLHRSPKRALTVGFGSGGTSWSMTRYDIEATVAEIEREVIRSAHLFKHQNQGVVGHPRLKIVINDARDHIHTTSTRYDVISSDVTNIDYRQNSSLYAVEFFRMMARNLAEGGIGCSWIPGELPVPAMKILLRSFQEAFPNTSVWFMNHTDTNFLILIGTEKPIRVDLDRFEAAYAQPEVAEDLKLIHIMHPYQIASFLVAGGQTVRQWTDGSPLHTDDHPILEFAIVDSSLAPAVNLGQTLRDLSQGFPPLDTFHGDHVDQKLLEAQIGRGRGLLRGRVIMSEVLGETNPTARMEQYIRGEQIADEILRLVPGDLRARQLKHYFANQRRQKQGQ